MKKSIRIILPIILAIAIILCTAWYLFVYDRAFTRDMLLSFARYNESQGNHSAATWFYNRAYSHAGNSDDVAIELAQQYKSSGNYTKAEYTLSNAIADGGGIDVYIALCKTYVEQDKLLDAVTMLDSITNTQIKAELESIRPSVPTALPDPGFYSQYISVTLESTDGTLYVSTDGQYPSTATPPYSQPIPLNDGENTIYAVAVAENGLVSPVTILGYTIGGVVELMDFADGSVEAEVRKILNTGDNTDLYTNDLWSIKSFTMPESATSYADLRYFTFLESLTITNGISSELNNISSLANLTELTISDTSVSQDNLATISGLPLLMNLTLDSCSLSTISGLEKATALVMLDLSNNTIRNLSPLSSLTNLQELNLQHNAVADLSALSSLSALTKLDISSNAISALSPLSSLTALTWLNAETNTIADLGEISKLTSLSYLNLNNNSLTDVSGIAACTALTELYISTNAIIDIGSLSTLTNMMYFDFSYNQVTELPNLPKDCALVTINGSNNLLSSLDSLGGLKHLNNITMDYNTEISSIKALTACPVLVEVNVYATKVKDVTPLTNQSVIVNFNPVQ